MSLTKYVPAYVAIRAAGAAPGGYPAILGGMLLGLACSPIYFGVPILLLICGVPLPIVILMVIAGLGYLTFKLSTGPQSDPARARVEHLTDCPSCDTMSTRPAGRKDVTE